MVYFPIINIVRTTTRDNGTTSGELIYIDNYGRKFTKCNPDNILTGTTIYKGKTK